MTNQAYAFTKVCLIRWNIKLCGTYYSTPLLRLCQLSNSRYPPIAVNSTMIQVAGFFMPILSVFAILCKGRFSSSTFTCRRDEWTKKPRTANQNTAIAGSNRSAAIYARRKLCYTGNESEGFLWPKFCLSATARFDPAAAYQAMLLLTTLCNGFMPFVLLAYYFWK